MRSILVVGIALLGLASGTLVVAQQADAAGPSERQPRHENGRDETPLTAEQAARVTAILAKYDPSTLTPSDARAIHRAFRDAGLRGGPALRGAIEAAGFDARKLRELAPPPGGGRSGDGGRDGDDRSRRHESDSTGQYSNGGERERPGQDDAPAPDEHRHSGSRDDSDVRRSGDNGGPPPQGSDRDGRRPREDGGGRARQDGQGGYSIAQATSDRAQLHTIAFSGLAFLTGDFGASTFLPPGKVCDYFGFQYMRDIDAAGRGHNPMFLNRVAGNVLHVLNDGQRQLFAQLAQEQASPLEQLARKRYPVIEAFHRHLSGGSLDRDAAVRAVGDIFALDAQLSYRRAEVFGKVALSLTASQKEYLGRMKFGDFSSWPDLDERDALQRPPRGGSRLFGVAYMTYASEFFSWYAGSVEADTYFCPERHGTYFGGFYMKDMPAMGKRDYDISTSVTGDRGEAFLALLRPEQRTLITSVIEQQRASLALMVELRRAVATELRGFLQGRRPDEQKVVSLGRRYGELDGAVSCLYATAFAGASRTLTADQRAAMAKLRNLDGYRSASAYIYSQPIDQEAGRGRPAGAR